MLYSPAGSINIVEKLEAQLGTQLNEEQQGEIELWQKGRALQALTGHYGWPVLQEMLQSYSTDATRTLLQVDPAQREEVVAQHAVAYAANRLYVLLVDDIKAAIEASNTTPVVLKQGIRAAGMPVESAL
jgi:hypothetical protein